MFNVMIYPTGASKYASRKIRFKSWEEFIGWLHEMSKRTLPSKEDNCHMISGFSENGRRRKPEQDVKVSSSFFCGDFDNLTSFPSINEFVKFLKSFGYEFVIYSSASSRPTVKKCRVVFLLNRPIHLAEYKHFWYNINLKFKRLLDPSHCHIERTQGLPAQFDGALNYFYYIKGNPIDVDAVKAEFKYVPKTDQGFSFSVAGYADYKDRRLQKTKTWNNLRDCPFYNPNMAASFYATYNIDNSGRYHKFYGVMCSIAGAAYSKGYDLSVKDLVDLMREIDYNKLYEKRAIDVEAKNAILYARKNR